MVAPFGNVVRVRSARQRRRARSETRRRRLRRRHAGARRLHRQRRHRQRPRLARRHVRQGAAAVDAGANWEARVIFSAERDRDGDYALGDLDRARANAVPRCSATSRASPTATSATPPSRCAATASAVVHEQHRLRQLEDRGRHRSRLHAAAAGDAQQRRGRHAVHAGGARSRRPPNAPVQLSDTMTMKWQAGVIAVHAGLRAGRGEHAGAVRAVAAVLDFPVQQYSPDSALDDLGIGVFGQATFTCTRGSI